MKIYGNISFLFIVIVCSRIQFCFSNLESFFRLEVKDAAVDNNIKPILNESTSNEVECYMKCLDNQGKCRLLQMKEEPDKVSCSLYNTKLANASFHFDAKSKIISVVDFLQSKDCKELRQNGRTKDGVYNIFINGTTKKVFCDMTTDGGGWTIIQRRIDGSVDFDRTWDEYKNGFGDVDGECWLGNKFIHQMTKGRKDVLIRIEGMDFQGVRKHITMKGFWIEDKFSKYRLHVGTKVNGERGLIRNWVHHEGRMFSTKDQDNDGTGDHCGKNYGGGWWYAHCFRMSPNGLYSNTGSLNSDNGIIWVSWTTDLGSLKFIKMQIK